MSPRPRFLAVDVGTHSSRTLLFDRDGACVDRAAVALALHAGAGGEVTQDPVEILDATRMVLERVGRNLGSEPLAGGVATQRASVLAWRRSDGAPLTPVLSWQDTRAADLLAAHAPRTTEVRDLTGLFPSPHFGASKLRWLMDRSAEVRAAARAGDLCLGPLSAWLLSRLTGRPPWVDPANAQRTLLWDRRTADWSSVLLDAFGLERRWLPVCRDSRFEAGEVAVGSARVAVQLCTGDQAAAVFARGRPACDEAIVNLGTGAFVLRRLATGEAAAPELLETVAWRAGVQRIALVEGTVNGGDAALRWWRERRGEMVEPARIERVLAATGPEPVPFLNAVGGLGSPDWHTGLTAQFAHAGSADAELAGILESIIFLVVRNLEHIGSYRRLRVSGGLGGANGLCERLASLTGRPVLRDDEREATALGLLERLGGPVRAGGSTHRFEPHSDPALESRRARWEAWLAAMLGSSPAAV